MLVYRSENPRAMKGKKREHLPVFWRSNKTAWVTKVNFEEWFLQSFVPEVKEFLAKKNLDFKILLTLDNCKSHDESLQDVHPNVQVVFLPPNTTSLIQPLDQSVIATFKSYYLRRVIRSMVHKVNVHRNCENFIPEKVVKSFWKNFSIMDAINFIDDSWKEVQSTTITASWKKLLLGSNVCSIDQSEFQEVVRDVASLAKEVEGEGFRDIEESDILEVVLPVQTDFTPEELEEISTYSPQEDTDIVHEEKPFDAKAIVEIINFIENAIDKAVDYDPIVVRSLQFKRLCEEAINVYEELYKDILRRTKQSKLTQFFKKI